MKNVREAIHILGVRMHPWTMRETVEVIADRLDRAVVTHHVAINVAKLVALQRDRGLAEAVKACDIVSIDGMGIVWGGRLLGAHIPERVAGVDLFYELIRLAAARQEPVYFLGARQETVATVVEKLSAEHPGLRVAGWHHGFFWDREKEVVDAIVDSRATMLFVAISSPKKEQFINRWKDQLGIKFVMGVGGTFDIVAGVTRRAPVWMQRAGLEWLFRLFEEPCRMWRRYLVTNTLFALLLFWEKLSGRGR